MYHIQQPPQMSLSKPILRLFKHYQTSLFYTYNCTNAVRYNIMISLLADSTALTKLFKYKVLQLNSEEKSV